MEAEADWKALEVSRDPDSVEGAMIGLSETSLGDPDPPSWVQLLLGTHPALADRVAMAHAWERPEAAAEMFPATEPYDSGLLDVGDGHECTGSAAATGRETARLPPRRPRLGRDARPAAVLRPGAVPPSRPRRAGRAQPQASEPDADLARTRPRTSSPTSSGCASSGIEKWTSSGCPGERPSPGLRAGHRRRVDALVLGPRDHDLPREVAWLTHDVGRIFPEEWERFAAAVPALRHLPLVDAYAELLFDPDPDVRDHAACEWCAWEDAHVSLAPGHRRNPRFDDDPEYRLRFARLVTHYWRHAAFLEEDQLIRDAATLNGIPGVLIHGRYDVSSPLETAWRLSRNWTTSRLQVLDDAGHGAATRSSRPCSRARRNRDLVAQVSVYSGPEPPSGGVRRPPFAEIAPHWTQFDGVLDRDHAVSEVAALVHVRRAHPRPRLRHGASNAMGDLEMARLVVARAVARCEDRGQLVEDVLSVGLGIARGAPVRISAASSFGASGSARSASSPSSRSSCSQRTADVEAPVEGLAHVPHLVELLPDAGLP